jgi:hypothetical protein
MHAWRSRGRPDTQLTCIVRLAVRFQDNRLTMLHKLYCNLDPASLNEVLADDFVMLEQELEQGTKRKYGKQGIGHVLAHIIDPFSILRHTLAIHWRVLRPAHVYANADQSCSSHDGCMSPS